MTPDVFASLRPVRRPCERGSAFLPAFAHASRKWWSSFGERNLFRDLAAVQYGPPQIKKIMAVDSLSVPDFRHGLILSNKNNSLIKSCCYSSVLSRFFNRTGRFGFCFERKIVWRVGGFATDQVIVFPFCPLGSVIQDRK